MDMDKNKEEKNDELLNRIRKELTAILAEEKSGDPARKISYESILKPNTLAYGGSSIDKPQKYQTVMSKSYRQAIGGKSITMKPSNQRLPSGQEKKLTESTSKTQELKWKTQGSVRNLDAEFVESQAAKSIDEDLQKMQLELKQSYELFQGIGEKFESINFGGLKKRIRDLHLNTMSNDMGKVTTMELQKIFEHRYAQNRLDKLTADVTNGFHRHPGEFGDIPELSTFFQACTQLEHGLDKLKQQRKRSSELEKRLCWATEIAYDRMDEIRNAVGSKPETNF